MGKNKSSVKCVIVVLSERVWRIARPSYDGTVLASVSIR